MACMEHYCTKCGWIGFSNDHGPSECPDCGNEDIGHTWDEENDNNWEKEKIGEL